MFSLIRRISHSVIPRPDRPWEDDPTSNAPNTRRKRRLSSTERLEDTDDEQTRKKKPRGESTELDLGSEDTAAAAEDAGHEEMGQVEDAEGLVTVRREGSLEVKDVTKGVKEVELDDKGKDAGTGEDTDAADALDGKDAVDSVEGDGRGQENIAHPESIPLPEEQAGELDELRSSPPPQPQPKPNSLAATATEAPADPTPTVLQKSAVDDRGENDSVASRPASPTKVSTRKSRSSPKKVAKTKA